MTRRRLALKRWRSNYKSATTRAELEDVVKRDVMPVGWQKELCMLIIRETDLPVKEEAAVAAVISNMVSCIAM